MQQTHYHTAAAQRGYGTPEAAAAAPSCSGSIASGTDIASVNQRNTDHLASLYRLFMHHFPLSSYTLSTTHICDGAAFCLGQAPYLRQENPRE
jgi:hypothetical protein